MFSIFRTLIDRFKALFMTHAILELEADLIAFRADRKADLLRRADQFEQEGQQGIGQELRHRAELLSIDQPLVGVQKLVAHLQNEPLQITRPADSPPNPAPTSSEPAKEATPTATTSRKKKGMSLLEPALMRHFRAVFLPLAMRKH